MSISVSNKPPLGLRPRFIVDYDRALEILQACIRYIENRKPIEDEWLTELKEINDRMALKNSIKQDFLTYERNNFC